MERRGGKVPEKDRADAETSTAVEQRKRAERREAERKMRARRFVPTETLDGEE